MSQFYQLLEKLMKLSDGADSNLSEHNVYKKFPGKKASYREDHGNTNKLTIKHAHAYAKPKGKGKELYSVNMDGSGHDGYSGTEIPKDHADFFRSKGYQIDQTNILESITYSDLSENQYTLWIFELES